MTIQLRYVPILVCGLFLSIGPVQAQTPERRHASLSTKAQEQTQTPNADSTDSVANELEQLRKALQTLNARLREIIDNVALLLPNQSSAAKEKQNRLVLILELLGRAEQRAELMRRQLFEVIEKETSLRSRILQIDEDMRPESIERSQNLIGTTRTAELRDTKRRILENDRKGYESLLNQTTQSRVRLEEDVKQADLMVSRLRQSLFPLIEKEIDKINPN